MDKRIREGKLELFMHIFAKPGVHGKQLLNKISKNKI